ncbi:hypothetical protein [Rubrivirga marina]|uniref:Uncharacterized protein n=1 Tax=Rubrivirga marina TaxID=1196024 RepID=A0A271J0Q4_9BACT|nr:hypothetical protein [Rubrivirga marina]PAP76535.1 hypothetical protein BSZ37_08815 [Rubrivirga marina]
MTPRLALAALALLAPLAARAQFVDDFDDGDVAGWDFFTGDGDATMDFEARDGVARMSVDATADRHNVWWAILKRPVSEFVDLERLAEPGTELRVEARIRLSDAPRRVNVMINTNRTTDFHEHLAEYDVADTDWHTISYTTTDLDVRPGDTLYVQLGMTDWGLGTYHLDLDAYRAEVVDTPAAPDLGEPLPYHPPTPPVTSFAHHLAAAHDAPIRPDEPDVAFGDWRAYDGDRAVPVLSVGGDQWAVLRWDLGGLDGATADGPGLLTLTTHSVARGGGYVAEYGEDLGMEFGKVRVVEVLGGDPDWDDATVTYDRLLDGRPLDEAINGQMIFDTDVAPGGGTTTVTISRPVLQRILDGTTTGLLLRPLGAIHAAFYATEHEDEAARPTLHFSTR